MIEYDYELIYKKGTSNVVADALSRQPELQLNAISAISSDLLSRIQNSWISDPPLGTSITQLKTTP